MNERYVANCPVCGCGLTDYFSACPACNTPLNWQQYQEPQYQQTQYQQGQYQKAQYQKPQSGYQALPPENKKASSLWAVLGAVAVVAVVMVGVWMGSGLGSGKNTGNPVAGTGDTQGNAAVTDENLAEKTVMYYVVGSNLETDNGFMSDDIAEMVAGDLGENYKIVMQTGGAKKWHYKGIEDGKVQRFEITDDKITELDNLGKKNMCDPDTLESFIKFAKESYPAKEYVLIMSDHGGGIPMGFGMDDMFPGETLTITEIRDAIESSDIHFQSINFDACLMGTLEVVYSLKDVTDYIVASENVSWSNAEYAMIDYTAFVNNMQRTDVEETYYLEQITNAYVDDTSENKLTASMSVYRTSQADSVYQAYMTYMGQVYDEVLKNGRLNEYIRAREASEVAMAQCVGFEEYGFTEEEMIENFCFDTYDIVTFAGIFKTEGAAHLISTVSNIVLTRDANSSNLHGLSAYAPYYYPESRYAAGRELLEELDYDDKVIGLFDSVYSFCVGSKASTYDWYDDSVVAAYTPSTSGTQVCAKKVKNKNGQLIWEINHQLVVSAATTLWVAADDDKIYCLGEDVWYALDENYDLIVTVPDTWMTLHVGDESAALSYVGNMSYTASDGSEVNYGYIVAYVNGVLADIVVSDKQTTGADSIDYMGYYWDDGSSDKMMRFKSTDTIEFVQMYYNPDTDDWGYDIITTPLMMNEFSISRSPLNLSRYECMVQLSIKDIYGEEHETDLIEIR